MVHSNLRGCEGSARPTPDYNDKSTGVLSNAPQMPLCLT